MCNHEVTVMVEQVYGGENIEFSVTEPDKGVLEICHWALGKDCPKWVPLNVDIKEWCPSADCAQTRLRNQKYQEYAKKKAEVNPNWYKDRRQRTKEWKNQQDQEEES